MAVCPMAACEMLGILQLCRDTNCTKYSMSPHSPPQSRCTAEDILQGAASWCRRCHFSSRRACLLSDNQIFGPERFRFLACYQPTSDAQDSDAPQNEATILKLGRVQNSQSGATHSHRQSRHVEYGTLRPAKAQTFGFEHDGPARHLPGLDRWDTDCSLCRNIENGINN